MKITKSQLKQIIKEELEDLLGEEELGEGRMAQALGTLALAGGIGAGAAGINYGVGAAKDAVEDYQQHRVDVKDAALEKTLSKWEEQSDKIYALEQELKELPPDSPDRRRLELEIERAEKHLLAIKHAHASRSSLNENHS